MTGKPTYEELAQRAMELEREVDNRKCLGDKLRRCENNFRNFLDNLVDIAFETDASGNVTYANRISETIVGVPLRDIIGKPFLPLFIKESQEPAIDVYQRTLNGEGLEFELTFISGRTCHFKSQPLRDRDGKVIGVLGIARDITARRQTEEALRESERRYRILLENLPQKIFYKDLNSVYVTCNENYARDKCITPDEVTGKTDYDFYPKDLADKYRADDKRIIESGEAEEIQEQYVQDGRDFVVQTVKTAVRDERGNVIGLLGIFWDITESKNRELAIQKENIKLKTSLKDRYRFGEIVGKSAVMQEVYELILKASETDANVVISGESGTGKDLIARTIHEISRRSDKAFVPVNCGAIPENLFESEFFGHRKGAFTGAYADKHGLFDYAHEGTLFLDEVGELSLQMQVKLLRAIDDRGYTPVGDNQIRNADLRLITATNRNLMDMVKQGLMREDFFYRVYIIPIVVPALRARKEDIPLLVDHFMRSHSNGNRAPKIPGKVMDILCDHDWPGNVRQLHNVLERYLVVGHINFLGQSALKMGGGDVFNPEGSPDILELNAAVHRFEKTFIATALNSNGWNRSKTAAKLGISRKTLFRKMKNFEAELTHSG